MARWKKHKNDKAAEQEALRRRALGNARAMLRRCMARWKKHKNDKAAEQEALRRRALGNARAMLRRCIARWKKRKTCPPDNPAVNNMTPTFSQDSHMTLSNAKDSVIGKLNSITVPTSDHIQFDCGDDVLLTLSSIREKTKTPLANLPVFQCALIQNGNSVFDTQMSFLYAHPDGVEKLIVMGMTWDAEEKFGLHAYIVGTQEANDNGGSVVKVLSMREFLKVTSITGTKAILAHEDSAINIKKFAIKCKR